MVFSIIPAISRVAVITLFSLILTCYVFFTHSASSYSYNYRMALMLQEQLERTDSIQTMPILDLSATVQEVFIPKKIWQTSKAITSISEPINHEAITSWLEKSPSHRYEALTFATADSYMRERFASRPDYISTFAQISDPILRADLIRYFTLLGDGGVYSDLDTILRTPIDDWIPLAWKADVKVVVGVEYDVLSGPRANLWTRDLQFCTWALMASPGHRLLGMTVDHSLQRLFSSAEKAEKAIADFVPSFEEVLDTTGPAMFTDSVFAYLSEALHEPFTWRNVTGTTSPRLVQDVLILPIQSFGSGQAHSGSGAWDLPGTLVQHTWRGSWKEDRKHSKEWKG